VLKVPGDVLVRDVLELVIFWTTLPLENSEVKLYFAAFLDACDGWTASNSCAPVAAGGLC
jgi:hypothetical protein